MDTPPLMAVGTFVVDYHKVVGHYPRERQSTLVKREQVSNGGAPLNVLVNLSKLGVRFPLYAAAKVGQDLDGRMILDLCTQHGIDTSQVTAVAGASTGYTDVFTVEDSGLHTCFHYSGIGDTFSRKDVKLRAVKPKILFLGSLGALGRMDNYNPDYGRKGATQLLRDAHKQDITTVIEIAPIDGKPDLESYVETIAVADYLVINDRLAEDMLGTPLSPEGQFDPDLACSAAQCLIDHGLRRGVIIRAAASAVFVAADGSHVEQSCKPMPAGERKGSAGVDHAFGAGFLEGLYHDKPMDICLLQGLAVANACRRDLTPSDSIPSLVECMA